MPDAALRAVVREEMGLPPHIALEKSRMLQLIHVDGNNKGITDLTGLEFATNLRNLHVGGNKNQITDLRPLANLTSLTHLYIWRTPLKDPASVIALDIRPLANLINLEALSLAGNWD